MKSLEIDDKLQKKQEIKSLLSEYIQDKKLIKEIQVKLKEFDLSISEISFLIEDICKQDFKLMQHLLNSISRAILRALVSKQHYGRSIKTLANKVLAVEMKKYHKLKTFKL